MCLRLRPEVKEESQVETGRFQIGESLTEIPPEELFRALHFDEYATGDDQVDAKEADLDPPVVEPDRDFGLERDSTMLQLDSERACVGSLRQSVPEFVVHLVEGTHHAIRELRLDQLHGDVIRGHSRNS